MGVGYRQDMPPAGGYPSINWAKQLAKKGPSGFKIFGMYIGVTGVAWGLWALQTLDWKRKRLEMIDSRIALEPLLMAEIDRMYLKYMRKNRDEENELMKDVPGWKTGTLWGEPVYHNIRGRYIMPAFEEYMAHISWWDMYNIVYERLDH